MALFSMLHSRSRTNLTNRRWVARFVLYTLQMNSTNVIVLIRPSHLTCDDRDASTHLSIEFLLVLRANNKGFILFLVDFMKPFPPDSDEQRHKDGAEEKSKKSHSFNAANKAEESR